MKIMLYINTIGHGGAERVLVNLANQFSKIGHDVVLVYSIKEDVEYETYEAVEKKLLCDGSMPRGFIKRNVSLTKKLRRLLKEYRPDILISFMAEPNFRAIAACFGLKTKNLISIRNDPNREYHTALQRMCAKFLYRYADGIVFQTQDAKDWFSPKIQKKSRIIFNQVDERFFEVERPASAKDVVTVGRFTDQKNHKMLIEAFSKISDKVSENLIIYGDGSNRGKLEEHIEKLGLTDRVLLPGSVTGIHNIINSAKLFVLSSDYEGMPNALMEAMTLGLPCISTDCPCGGPKMLFADGGGVLVPINDADALAEKMLYLLTHSDECEKLSIKAKQTAQNFLPKKVFAEWNEYVEKLVCNDRIEGKNEN